MCSFLWLIHSAKHISLFTFSLCARLHTYCIRRGSDSMCTLFVSTFYNLLCARTNEQRSDANAELNMEEDDGQHWSRRPIAKWNEKRSWTQNKNKSGRSQSYERIVCQFSTSQTLWYDKNGQMWRNIVTIVSTFQAKAKQMGLNTSKLAESHTRSEAAACVSCARLTVCKASLHFSSVKSFDFSSSLLLFAQNEINL